ncbi:MAG: TonB-dependent receptor plug domain-containing protein [Robiginitomaculum sp.]|nr:TonB-dependent receptor plug domain-containing protein [Robiginitomaculum sp.]
MRIQNKFVTTAICVGATFVFTTIAFAQDANDRYVLRVDGGKLGKVVDDVHKQTDLEFIYSFDLVNADGINPVNGKYTLDEALAIMFEGTGLSGGLTDSGMIVITREKSAQAQTLGEDNMISKNTKRSLLASVSALIFGAAQVPALAQESTNTAQSGVQNVAIGSGIIVGHVTDVNSGAPLAGAILVLEGTKYRTSTDVRGQYRFPNVPSGRYVLNIDYLGSPSQSMDITVGAARNVQNFELGSPIDEVVTTGTRSSLAQALNQQRSAPNSSTVVSSDLLNSFPAENVSEALRRVSGVTFSRNAATGDGTSISVRGFNQDAINIQLNGLELQGTGIDRGVDLSNFLADNISKITIHKSLLPSHESSGSGGLVEIETRSGLDYGDKYLSVGLEREQGFAGGFGDELQANITVAKSFGDNFGVSANLQYRDTNRMNIQVANNQDFITVLPEGQAFTFRLPVSLGTFPFEEQFSEPLRLGAVYTQREREQENLTASINLAWDISDHTALRFDVQRSNVKADTSFSRTTQGFFSFTSPLFIPELDGAVRSRRNLGFVRPSGDLDVEQNELTTTTYSFRGDTDVGPWELEYKAGISRSVSDQTDASIAYAAGGLQRNILDFINPEGIVTNVQDNAAMDERVVSDGALVVGDGIFVPNFSQFGLDFINDASNYDVLRATRSEGLNISDSKTLELRTRYNFSTSFVDYFEVGGRYSDTERTNSNDVLGNVSSITQNFVRRFGSPTSLTDLGVNSFGNSLDLSIIGADGFSVPFLGAGNLQNIINQVANLTEDDPNTPENERRFRLTDNTVSPLVSGNAISPLTITEKNIAGWLQSKVTLNKLEVVGGVRFEQVDFTGSSISSPSIRMDPGFFNFLNLGVLADAGLVQFVDTSGVQNKWTPSLLASYRHSDNFVSRLAYFRSTTNPSLAAISGNESISLDLRAGREAISIREPNSDLAPTIVENFDLDFSYFFKDNPGLIRFGAFYKKTSNNFTNVISPTAETGDLRARVAEVFAPLEASEPGIFADILALPDTTESSRVRPENGEGGDIYGVELEIIRQLDFLPQSWPEYLSNFSVLGNLTYTTGDFPTNVIARDDNGQQITLTFDRFLLGQSEWAGNASLRYDDGSLSGSLIYTYQAASVRGFNEFDLNTITPEFSTLDFRLQYSLGGDEGKGLYTVFFEGDDLLKGRETADILGATSSQFGIEQSELFHPNALFFGGGRTFTVGVRARF